MFTAITLWIHPVWDDAIYGATATWDAGDGQEPVHLHKEGTIALNGAESPEEILLLLARILDTQRGLRDTPANVGGG